MRLLEVALVLGLERELAPTHIELRVALVLMRRAFVLAPGQVRRLLDRNATGISYLTKLDLTARSFLMQMVASLGP